MKHITNLASIFALLALISGTAQAAIGVNGDTYSIPSDGLLLVEADGVITNDTMDDVDGSPQFVLDIASNIVLSVVSPPSQGSLTCPGVAGTAICQDGSFQYSVDPTAFTGVDSFTYRLEVNSGLPSYEFAEATVTLTACTSTGTVTTCWSEGGFFDALAALEDPANPYYVKHEGFEGAAWSSYRSYQDANFNWVYNGATTITSNGIDWSSNHPATNILSTSTGAVLSGQYGVFDPDHGYATNTSVGECQALEAADPNGVVPEQCLPHDGFSGSSATTLYAVGGYIKGSNSAANISVSVNGGAFTNIGKLVTPAHQFYGIIDTNGFNSFRFHDIDGKTGQPLYIFGDDFYLVTRDAADANQAPVLGTVTNQTVAAGQLFQIDIPVSDPDNDAMAYVLSGVPKTGAGSARLLDNGTSIRIRWITPADSAGLYSVSVTATDNGYPRISSVLNFDLTITPPPPTLSLPGNISQEATSSAGAVVTYSATATDVTDGSLTPSCAPASGSSFALGATTVSCSVTNSNSLTSSGSFIVNVVDTTAPTVTAPLSISVEATGPTTAVNLGTASATDLVDGNLTPLPNNTGPFSVGMHQITWSVSDTAGNTGTAVQTVTITDTIAPSISLPANITAEATASTGAVVNFSVNGNDTVSGLISGSCAPASGSTFSPGLTTVNCSVTDAAGNSTSGSFTVSVVDTTPPQITAPANITTEATGLTTAVSLGVASASDLVSGSLNATANNTGPFAVGTHSIVWSATDAAGNTGTATQMVTITDTSGPVLNLPADLNVEATSAAGATVTYSASASDLVDGSVVINCTPASGSNFALGINLVNCNASDNSAHTSSGSFNITVVDTTAPTVTVPLDITLEATGPTTVVNLGTATATDAVTALLSPAADNTGPFTVGVHTITWSATDAAGNTGSATQTVTITDTSAPILTLPASINTEATSASGAVVNYSVSANDTVDGTLIAGCSPISGSSFALGVTAVSCSVTDSASLTTSGSFNITVADTTAPLVTAPLDITVEATGATTAVALGTASATDAVTALLSPAADNTGPFAVGVHTITWSATDAALNTGTATQLVTITDTSPPVLSLPATVIKEASAASGAIVSYTASANDTVDGVLPAGCLPASGSRFVIGTTLVTCTATDSSNLTASGSFNVTVVDSTAPVVTAPANIIMEATGATTDVNLGTATATDLVDGSILASPDNSGPFTVGVHTITWSATDSALNTGTATQTVTITDTGAPVLNLPANMVVEATAASGALVSYSVSANDIVDGSLVPVCTPASGTTFALGTVSVSCSVTDSANLTTSGGFSISVVDTTAPVVTAPANITTEATGSTTVINLGIASASDLVSGVITPTASNGGPFTVGVFNIIWSATDTANNTGTASQTITITDTTAPGLNLPAGISQGAASPTGATVNYTATANDIADGSIVPACLPASGSTFTLGTTIVNCSATDSSGNVASGSFNVTITDTGAPTLILPANISAQATSAAGAIVNYSASANDAIDGALAASCLPGSGSTFGLGSHIVNCSAQDLQGNSASGSFSISVIDTSAPTVTAPVDITVEATGATTSVTLGSASATDLVSGTLVPVASNSGPFTVGVHTVIWSATDAANNTGTATQIVTVTDTTVPTLVLPLNLTQEATSAAGAIVNYSASANDLLDGALIPACLPASGSSFALGRTIVSCTVTDTANLSATGSFNVTIVDTTAPVVIAPANISIEATGSSTAVALGTATASDIVSGVLPVTADNTGPFAVGVHSITWSATDAANNTGSATQIVTITDIGSPSLNLPANLTVEATSASGAVVSYSVTASDVVDGSLTASCTPVSGSTFALGSTIVNCSATDSSNLTTSGSFSVTVQDTTAPVLTLPADINIDTVSNSGAIVSYLTSATDAVDGAVLPNCTPVSGSSFALGTTVVNCNATDSANNTSSGSFNVTVISTASNNQPVANAGIPQTVSAGISVTLDGSASSDPDGDALQYQWSLVAVPQGSQSAVINANSVIASFAADMTGDYIAQLIVTDIHNLRSVASRVTITVINNAPVADAGSVQSVMVGDLVTLDGSLSSDVNGDVLSYRWTLTVPTGSSAVLSNAASATPQFSVDVAGLYTAQLIVNDGLIDSTAATVTITAQQPPDAPPTITAPADIRVASSGYLTPVTLGVATAADAEDGPLTPVANNTGPFAPGRYEIVWSVTDSGNNTVSAIQVVEVLPLLDLPLDQQAEVGSLIQLKLNMNGFAPQYPVDIIYDVTVNGVTSQHSLSIASGKTAVIDYQLPAAANAGDRITFTLKSAVNAVIGANSRHTLTLINTNVAPVVDIEVMQKGVVTKYIHANAGLVTVSAIIHDANQGDSHTVDWSTTDNNIPVSVSAKTFSFNPSSLNDGHYKIGVKVVDSGLLEAENEIYVQLTNQDFNPPAGSDSDHDGVEDALEGDHDDDNDGIPNYLDAIDEQAEMLQMRSGEAGKWVLATQSGLSLRLGNSAQLSGLYAAGITSLELEKFAGLGRVTAPAETKDTHHTAIGGYIDFTIHGLSTPGQSVKLVIPLLSPVPDQAVYRKYSADTGWSTFVENAENQLSSAPGADGICPAPGSSEYLPGLEPGDYCVQMLIQDGGPNDNDQLTNGVITDPGGVAVASAPAATTPPVSTGTTSSGGGGGAIDVLLLLNMLMLLSLYYGTVVRHRITGGVR